jgi:Predicted aminoglycoside phosphotransferase
MGSTNAGEGDIPPWLNREFLATILSEEGKKNISVTDMDVKAAVSKGDNYLSTLYRIMVECNESNGGNEINKYFLILKTLPKGEIMQQLVSESQSFEKEMQMYSCTLPAMYCVTKAKLRPLSARYIPTKLKNVIVLEDLRQLGYKMANRHTGLDLEHCEMAVRALARFHAASVSLHKSDPACMDIYSEGIFKDTEEDRERMNVQFNFTFKSLASRTEEWPGYEHYGDKIRKMIPTVVDQMIKLLQPKKDSLNVLNHGDCWVNNIMFHYCQKTGKVDDIRLIDFQLARFSSPSLDLQYFLCTSTNDEVRFQQRDHILRVYHAELRDTLEALNLDPDLYTLEQLKEEFEEKEMFGLLTVCSMLWAMLASSSDVPDFSQLKEEDLNIDFTWEPLDRALSGSRYREVLQTFLRHYEDKGIL